MKRIKIAICLVFLCMVAFEGASQELSLEKKKEVLLYPNPVIGNIRFIVKSEEVISKVEVVNVIGKVINRTENDNFDIREVPIFVRKYEKGMYFVKITFEDKTSSIKKLLVK